MAASKGRPDATKSAKKTNTLGVHYLEQVRQLYEAKPSLYLLLLSRMLQNPPTGHTRKCRPAVIQGLK